MRRWATTWEQVVRKVHGFSCDQSHRVLSWDLAFPPRDIPSRLALYCMAQHVFQRSLYFSVFVLAFACLPCFADEKVRGSVTTEPEVENNLQTESERLFARHIAPILREKCYSCHGREPEAIEGALDVRSISGLLTGGDSGEPSIVLGEPEKSPLYLAATRKSDDWSAMPPKESEKLTAEQLTWLSQWIRSGATWPDAERVKQIEEEFAEGEHVLTSKALSEDWQNRRYDSQKLWVYRPFKVEDVPDGEHPVDWFVNQKIRSSDLEPAPPAKAEKLARRISFGLVGLPPDPNDVAQFSSAYVENPEAAVAEFANRLMATSHYGEHFGLRWLDVARYADSAGFANDYCRPNAWRYRDYVVRAFNHDKPYNDFVLEQIAGDEMDSGNGEYLIAVGYLRMGPWEQTGMSVFKETRQQWLDDVTDSVGQTFLGHAMQCAKCHDHKFDPVPTRDYYSMLAVFSTTQFCERNVPFQDNETKADFEKSNKWVEAKLASYREQEKQLNDHVAKLVKAETGEVKVGDNGLDPGDEASLARIKKNISRHRWELDRTRPIALSVYTGATIARKNVDSRILLPTDPWTDGHLENDAIFQGGNVYSLGDPVRPGSLSAAESLGEMRAFEFPNDKGKRRLALAQWIVDPKNPLTARVIVNRVWSWHFGKGIASNPNNLGGTGGAPTHPELLDFLAKWFVEHDWSIKQLNRLIVTSQTYRRSSQFDAPKTEEEFERARRLYALFLPRRLTAEELRDAMLVASGELNRQVGGIPARPDVNLEVAFQPRQIMGGVASVYEPDPLPQQRNRRTLYVEKIRGLRDPFLESFNQPGSDKSFELRETSTVAPQALTLFNSSEVLDRAFALAVRLIEAQLDDESTINRAFELTLGRIATDQEQAICRAHWKEAVAEESYLIHSVKTIPAIIERTVMAEKTGEPYRFEEHMPAYSDYQPDVQPASLDARTRGLAQVCLVLFNLNEFAYLD